LISGFNRGLCCARITYSMSRKFFSGHLKENCEIEVAEIVRRLKSSQLEFYTDQRHKQKRYSASDIKTGLKLSYRCALSGILNLVIEVIIICMT